MLISKLKNVFKLFLSKAFFSVKKPVLGTGALCAQCSECTLQRLWMRPTKILETSEMMINWINDQRMIIIVILLLDYYSSYQWSWNIMKMKFLLLLWWLWLDDDQQDFPIVRQSSSCRHATECSWPRSAALISSGSTSAKKQQVRSLIQSEVDSKPAGRSAAALSICPMCQCYCA